MSNSNANKTTFTRAKGGTAQREEPIDAIMIPDCWHAAEDLRALGYVQAAEAVMETWQLAHDLKRHVQGG